MNLQSIQEAAVSFANTLVASLNSTAAEMYGVDVMWFRAIPDKKNQDVIFQSYTLYGVEDCPMSFKAMYSDTNYDDAAITYQIMGISYAIPMTLEIALETWNNATNNDGSIPQQHDIVYIPINQKLLEVVSMQPVKAIGAKLTSYKVNLAIYTPTRNRIVGENLKESIENATVSRDKLFGEDIDNDIKDIIDDNQLNLYTSTNNDPNKEVIAAKTSESGQLDVRSVVSENLVIDGHLVANSHYNMDQPYGIVVKYNKSDKFTSSDERCLSCWVRINPILTSDIKNIKSAQYHEDDNYGYIDTSVGSKFKNGDNVVLKRGKIYIPGTVISRNSIQINKEQAKEMRKINENWYQMPGFCITRDSVINLLCSDNFRIDIKGMTFVSIKNGNSETLVRMQKDLSENVWYGIILNIFETISLDVYSGEYNLTKISSTSDIKNNIGDVNMNSIFIRTSTANMTNIRYYKTININTDKQIIDLVSMNAKNDSKAIINDSADIYLNKTYMGRQR